MSLTQPRLLDLAVEPRLQARTATQASSVPHKNFASLCIAVLGIVFVFIITAIFCIIFMELIHIDLVEHYTHDVFANTRCSAESVFNDVGACAAPFDDKYI